MAKSILVNQNKKRGPGRPATGRDPVVAVRLPDQALAKVDKWAADNDCCRSDAIRAMIDLAPAVPKHGRGK
jgi:hypothetical protein